MPLWLDKLPELGQKTWNTLRAVGPFMIAQSDKASEAFQRHMGRVAEAEALRDLLKSEVETRARVRQTLLENYIKASDVDRTRIERDLQYIDGVTRQLGLAMKSLSYGPKEDAERIGSESKKKIEGHWLDRYNDLSRQRNEEWRGELLARAFAQEATEPGSVSPRVLWLIGNMEESRFESLSTLLDLCMWIDGNQPCLPSTEVSCYKREHQNSDLKDLPTVGHLTFILGDLGVIADQMAGLDYEAGEGLSARYDQTVYKITPKKSIRLRGVLFTSLGVSIARFYDPQWNAVGRTIVDEWTSSLSPDSADVTEERWTGNVQTA